jgi:hypothetical protein
VAFASNFLPIRAAEDTVKKDKRGRRLSIGPCVAASVEVHLFERQGIDATVEPTHHPLVQVAIVFILISVN